jgi:hypothetical protein
VILTIFVGLAILGAFVKSPKSSPTSKHPKTTAAAQSPRPPRARVVISHIGFSRSSGDIDYGLTLTNKSERADAANLTVTVRAADTRGRSGASDTNNISVIPARESFNLAGFMSPNVSLKVTKLKVKMHSESVPRSIGHRLPDVTNVRLHTSVGGFVDVYATLTNRSGRPLSQDAPVYVQFLNSSGQIFDSSVDRTGAVVRPDASVRFHSLDVYSGSRPPTAARISVDACTYVQCLG